MTDLPCEEQRPSEGIRINDRISVTDSTGADEAAYESIEQPVEASIPPDPCRSIIDLVLISRKVI